MSQTKPASDSPVPAHAAQDRTMADSAWDDLTTVLQRAEQALASNAIAPAYAFYTRATELDPNNAPAWAGRAALTPDPDDAIVSWAYALALAPDNASAREALARRVGEKIAASGIADFNSLMSVGKHLAEAGQKQEAHRLFERATELDDTGEDAWIWRAGTADASKEMIASLNQVLALNPENKQAQAGIEWAMSLRAGASTPASPTGSEQAVKLVEEGQAALARGAKNDAYNLFRQATELDPTDEQGWLWRGSTTADVDEALTCMEQALEINPENAPALEARAWLRTRKLRLTAQSQPDAALAISTDRAAVRSTDRRREFLVALAVVAIFVLVVLIYLRLQGAI